MSIWLRNTAGLALLYVLTLASVKPGDVVAGVLLGGALAATLQGRLQLNPKGVRPGPATRLPAFFVWIAAILAEVVRGTWDVALRMLHLRPIEPAGIVRVPIGERTPRGVAVNALTTTLSPGSLLVDVDWDRREMILHVMDAGDPDAVRAREQRFYERYQRRVFP